MSSSIRKHTSGDASKSTSQAKAATTDQKKANTTSSKTSSTIPPSKNPIHNQNHDHSDSRGRAPIRRGPDTTKEPSKGGSPPKSSQPYRSSSGSPPESRNRQSSRSPSKVRSQSKQRAESDTISVSSHKSSSPPPPPSSGSRSGSPPGPPRDKITEFFDIVKKCPASVDIRVLETLHDCAGKIARDKKSNVVCVTDIATDLDDTVAMIILKLLHFFGLINFWGAVTNLAPAEKRALYLRGALNTLDLKKVRVAIGTDGVDNSRKDIIKLNTEIKLRYQFTLDTCTFMASKFKEVNGKKGPRFQLPRKSDGIRTPGYNLLLKLYNEAKESKRKITLLLISSLQDINDFCQTNKTLVKDWTEKVVIQGGYTLATITVQKPDGSTDTTKQLLPVDDTMNNDYNLKAAIQFYSFLQSNGIRSVCYGKAAAYRTVIKSSVVNGLAETGHDLGKHLVEVSKEQSLDFYKNALLPEEKRPDKYKRFGPKWFLERRTSILELPAKQKDKILTYTHDGEPILPEWKVVVPFLKFVVYDALAALGTVDESVLGALDVLEERKQRWGPHQVVGVAEGQVPADDVRTLDENGEDKNWDKCIEHYVHKNDKLLTRNYYKLTATPGINPARMTDVLSTGMLAVLYYCKVKGFKHD